MAFHSLSKIISVTKEAPQRGAIPLKSIPLIPKPALLFRCYYLMAPFHWSSQHFRLLLPSVLTMLYLDLPKTRTINLGHLEAAVGDKEASLALDAPPLELGVIWLVRFAFQLDGAE